MKVLLILLLTGFLSTNAAQLQCNAASKQKRVTLRNPSNSKETLCAYTIKSFNTNVCQLLIQFDQFELQPPTLNAQTNILECSDHLTIGDFSLCGTNTGQHLYFPFNAASGAKEFTMTFHLAQRGAQNTWSMTVTQLECPSGKKHNPFNIPFLNGNMRTFFPMDSNDNLKDIAMLAPPGCNQYYTQSTGTIKSFNFNGPDTSSYYLPNTKYVICIKTPVTATMIEYHAISFSMSEQENSFGFDDDCRSAVQTTGRREDFLMIPQSNVADNLNIQPTYYCGKSLQRHTSLLASPPFLMYFTSDGITDKTETGFHINYMIRSLF